MQWNTFEVMIVNRIWHKNEFSSTANISENIKPISNLIKLKWVLRQLYQYRPIKYDVKMLYNEYEYINHTED